MERSCSSAAVADEVVNIKNSKQNEALLSHGVGDANKADSNNKPLIHHHHHGASGNHNNHNEKNEMLGNLKTPPELLANGCGDPLLVASAKVSGNNIMNNANNVNTGNNCANQDTAGGVASAAAPTMMDVEQSAMASKEKIMEKKRKRMNMRREYEEEVQRQMRDSSESSSTINAVHDDNCMALEPGKPVTLEEVLSFTKTARYVM